MLPLSECQKSDQMKIQIHCLSSRLYPLAYTTSGKGTRCDFPIACYQAHPSLVRITSSLSAPICGRGSIMWTSSCVVFSEVYGSQRRPVWPLLSRVAPINQCSLAPLDGRGAKTKSTYRTGWHHHAPWDSQDQTPRLMWLYLMADAFLFIKTCG